MIQKSEKPDKATPLGDCFGYPDFQGNITVLRKDNNAPVVCLASELKQVGGETGGLPASDYHPGGVLLSPADAEKAGLYISNDPWQRSGLSGYVTTKDRIAAGVKLPPNPNEKKPEPAPASAEPAFIPVPQTFMPNPAAGQPAPEPAPRPFIKKP